MSVSNDELINKARITTEALAVAGKLNPAQADKFIDYVVDVTALRNGNARVVRFTNETLEINKIGVGRRVAVPKAEAADPAVRRGITTSKITLQPKEVMTPFEVGDNFLEINLEGANAEDRVVRMMATQNGNDLEELFVNGNTLGHAVLQSDVVDGGDTTRYVKDMYLALANGWMTLGLSGHVVPCDGQNIGTAVFGKILRAMPYKFKRNPGQLRWYMSPDLVQLWQEKLSTRATAMGDQAIQSGPEKVPGPFGIPMVSVPLWPFQPKIVEHIVLNGTTATPLKYGPITNVVVTLSTLAKTPVAAYVEDTDYTVNYSTGTITRINAAGISNGATVKVTYQCGPQIMLTHASNLIIGIGRDIRIEKDRDIYKGVNQYAITTKVDVQMEEVDAMVFGINIGTGL